MIVVTLSERLRRDTRTAHDAVDRAFSRFDVRTVAGLGGFLGAQREVAAMLRDAMDPSDPLLDVLRPTLDDLDHDLAVLGHVRPAAPLAPPAAPGSDHPLARSYVWLGSRLGMRMVARRWYRSADARVAAAGRSVARLQERSDWRPVSAALDAMSGRGREADAVTHAARDWFAILEQAAVASRRRVEANV